MASKTNIDMATKEIAAQESNPAVFMVDKLDANLTTACKQSGS
jgi:hypothetical protein